jgi:trk system potassium uptake protein TrkH
VVDGELVRLSLHAKLAITTTLVLYLAGLVLLWGARVLQGHEPAAQALLDAHFMSISARTAGFDTVPPAAMSPPARFLLVFLMFIGGSPGSTAGGVKTIATAAIALTIWSTVRGRSVTTAYGRTLSEAMVRKAAVLLVLGLATITGLIGTLVITEGALLRAEDAEVEFEHIVFESVSACSTVGLSMGVTGQLSDPGRVAVSAGMLLGRVGPLAFLVALVRIGAGGEDRWRYPSESVMMG